MEKPTMAQLRTCNPQFFTVDEEELQAFNDDRDLRIEREGTTWVLKVHTVGDTYPVYTIDTQMKLVYLRHGW